ncbi:uncharacterized protein C15orf39 homolog isoform X2 [Tachyglossus aculeatus]|uniref:uncharacterized protein C15orf39 homolog isoform X2 n=1 Tax=Tachyglossus aculeatus TaxID=9261 RepID=UPI0018F66446|nr:uncharacterized protein C15orf39 homolog isoform X2 [Tachyglossus aculeatus]
MAGKHPLGPLDPVMYGKMPRLETEAGHGLPATLCKSGALPGHPSGGHFSYKGTYFTYPLPGPEVVPESHAPWSPASAYGPYASQPLRADGMLMNCLLYRRETEHLEAALRSTGTEKGKDHVVRDLLLTREKWVSHLSHHDRLQSSRGPAFPNQKTLEEGGPPPPSVCAPLAAPKPMYRNPLCYLEPGCGQQACVTLGAPADSGTKRPPDVDWALPTSSAPLLHSGNLPCGALSTGPKKTRPLEAGFLPLPLSLPQGAGSQAREPASTPGGFSPFQVALENYRVAHSTSFLDAKHPAAYGGQKKGAEAPDSPTPGSWAKRHPFPASPLAPPPVSVFPERSSAHYPLAPHEQPLPFPPGSPHPEKPNGSVLAPQAPAGYPGYGYSGNGEVRALASPYLRQPAIRVPYPPAGPEPSAYRFGSLPMFSPAMKTRGSTRGDPELPPASGCRLDLPAPAHGFTFGLRDPALYSSPPAAEAAPGVPLLKDCTSLHSAFQPVQHGSRTQRGTGRLPEALPPGDPPCYLLSPGRGGSVRLLEGDGKGPGCHREEPPLSVPIVIPDSPIPPLPASLGQGEALCQTSIGGPGPPPQPPAFSRERWQLPKQADDAAPPPCSPPMPVIHNVFSLAPYRDYLDTGPEKTAELPLAKARPPGEPASAPCPAVRPRPSRLTRAPETQGTVLAAPGGVWDGRDQRAEGEEAGQGPDSQPPPLPKAEAPKGKAAGEGFGGRVEVALDLSLKKRPSEAGTGQSQDTCPVADSNPEGQGPEARPEPELQVPPAAPEATAAAPEMTTPVGGGFHSSVAFMFHKFKILKPTPSGGDRGRAPSAAAPPRTSSLRLLPRPSIQPLPLQVTCFNLVPSEAAPAPPGSPPGPPEPAEAPSPPSSSEQRFTGLHLSLCRAIACFVARSSPELLQQWLRLAEPQPREGPTSPPPRVKNGARASDPQKSSRGQAIWLGYEGVKGLLSQLLAQLDTFLATRHCPFPHVVRAGAIFIPIYLVKEKLFPDLAGASVDHVLQEHRVELRPTTLTEERLLRDLELHGCTSRMLKLLALKQLPDIYPDLLGLQWHNCVQQQLSSCSQAGQRASKRPEPGDSQS